MIRSPLQGEYRLFARYQKGVLTALRYENGELAGRYRVRTERVFDDLSLMYHIRVRPQAQDLAFVGLYGLVKGRLVEAAPAAIKVPAGEYQARVFRFDRPQAFFEVYLDKERVPVKVIFGYGKERISAELLRREVSGAGRDSR